jgi:hypothetical protein
MLESGLGLLYRGDWPARLWAAVPGSGASFESGLVYVSRGVGTVELPMRTFAPPDVLLLELKRAREVSSR